MRPTTQYIEQCIRDINKQCFDDELPMLPVRLSSSKNAIGKLSFVRKRTPLGKYYNTDYVMNISTLYDMDEATIKDTVAHEMIHYYIAWNGMRDTSQHGELFKQMMNTLNEKFGYHITVKHKLTAEQVESVARNKWYYVGVSTMNDGRMGITVSARTRLFELWDSVPRLPGVVKTEWYVTDSPFFCRVTASRRACVYFIPVDEFMPHLQNAKPLVREGDIIRVKK